MNAQQTIEVLKGSFPQLQERYGVRKIGIFGSLARGEERPESDVDVIVEFERPLGLKFIEFCIELENLLGRKVDVLTPAGMQSIRSSRIKQQIEKQTVYV